MTSLLRSGNKLSAFQGQQPLFGLDTAGIAQQLTVRANHPVAGQENGQRVRSDGGSDRPDGAGLA